MALVYIIDHDSGGAAARYRLHDIVDVADDCTVNIPPAAPFYILKITGGVTRAQVEDYITAHTNGTDRRLWKIDTAAIPSAWKTAFLANRYGECTVAQAKHYLLNKATGLHADGT